MATDKLIVELDADTSSLNAGLDASIDKMDDLDHKTIKSDKSLKSFAGSSVNAGKAMLGAGAAILAAGTALSTMIVATAMSRRELEIQSKQVKLSTENFMALSFATKQYGINGEQIADISKDIADKLGEFGTAGTGAFQDFADVIGITKEEAQVLAIQMQDMSGPQVIGELVGRMEEAGASTNDMTFALESMGNDLSRLIPLFSNNSKELNNLEGAFKSATKEMEITEEQAKELEEAAKSFDLLMSSLGSAATNIAANIAPSINNFFKGVISAVPEATQVINDFLEAFEHPSLSRGLNIAQTGTIQRDASGNVTGSTDTTGQIEKEIEKKVAAVKSEDEILAEVRKNARILEQEAAAEASASELERIQDRFKTETELLTEKLEEELLLIGEDKELKLSLENEYADNLVAIEREKNEKLKKESDKIAKIKKAEKDKEYRLDKKAAQEKDRNNDSILNSVKSLNTSLLDDNKAIGAGIIVADTARASMRAIADLGPIAGPIAAAAIAATGLTQLANLNGAERGGGSISGSSVAAVDSSIPEQAQESEQILLSQSDTENGNQSVIIKFEGDGNEITEALAKSMKVMQRSGALEA